MHCNGSYFRLGLLDSTYRIIDDGEEATVYHSDSKTVTKMKIKTSIGICIIIQVKYKPEPSDNVTIIEVN